jgi:hypothetical protein
MSLTKREPKSFSSPELNIHVDLSLSKLRLSWRGRSTSRDPAGLLKPFFDTLSVHIDKQHDIELDFREFEYMNSSTLKPILTFVQTAAGEARSVEVKYDAKKSWQRLSFRLLQAVSSTWNNVSVLGE